MMEYEKLIEDPLLKRAFHAWWIYNNNIYLHGGVDKYNSLKEPFEDVVEIQLPSKSVQPAKCKNFGPRKSHHRAIIIDEKWVCLIGGWDGRQRTSTVHALNMETFEWTNLSVDALCSPPVGLSGHTCTKVGLREIIISGREGGVRMQRRYGSVYKLTVNIENLSYNYKELPIHISSRSGHVSCLLEKNSMLNLIVGGGRDSDSAEIVGTWPKKQINFSHNVHELELRLKAHLPSQRVETQKRPVANLLIPTKPRSLRYHAAIEAGCLCLVHGGEVFGRARDTISGDIFVHNNVASKWWVKTCTAPILKRMGHSLWYDDGYLYIISGIGSNGKIPDGSVVSIPL
ncbi:kelch domain-containing protein 9-like [Styela clava]|uniref:kelch domain-containing protein 9-like n=1 Tax=Styela clava TaxID=7725 RepID=UPI00193AB7D6|nr:kelch domain-containing protein 9-like [Styela clava]